MSNVVIQLRDMLWESYNQTLYDRLIFYLIFLALFAKKQIEMNPRLARFRQTVNIVFISGKVSGTVEEFRPRGRH